MLDRASTGFFVTLNRRGTQQEEDVPVERLYGIG